MHIQETQRQAEFLDIQSMHIKLWGIEEQDIHTNDCGTKE